MSLSVLLAALWALAATAVALLPMRLQFLPGALLLLAAPALIWLLGSQHGWIAAAAALAAVLSMFRKPLAFYARKLRDGQGGGTGQ